MAKENLYPLIGTLGGMIGGAAIGSVTGLLEQEATSVIYFHRLSAIDPKALGYPITMCVYLAFVGAGLGFFSGRSAAKRARAKKERFNSNIT